MNIKDLDYMKLQPGDVLVLRVRKRMINAELTQLHATFADPQVPFLTVIIPYPDIDMIVGQIADEGESPVVAALDADDAYMAVFDAYHQGRSIAFRTKGDSEWIQCHRLVSPHRFDRRTYEYKLL